MEQYAIVLIVVFSIIGILLLGVCLILLARRYRSFGIGLGLIHLNRGDSAAKYGSTSAKLWQGGENPTDVAVKVDTLGGRTRKPTPDQARTEEDVRRFARGVSNFCRSTGHERVVKFNLPYIGRRSTKFHAIISDGKVNAGSIAGGGPDDVPLLLTMIATDKLSSPPMLSLNNPKMVAAWKNLLTQLRHPHVLPTYDASTSVVNELFLLRPWSEEGSIRDMIFADGRTPPGSAFGSKYMGVDPLSGLTFVRPGRGLRPEIIGKLVKGIIEGLRYLESQGVPYFHLHTGNVILVNGQAQLSDYENAFLGVKHRLHKKLRRMPGVDPQHAALVCLLYEIATGIEPQVLKRSAQSNGTATPAPSDLTDSSSSSAASPPPPSTTVCTLDLIIRDPKYAEVNDLIQLIVNAKHSVTYDELLAHAMFRNVRGSSVMRDPPRTLDSRTARLLQPILTHYSDTLFPGHPNHSSIVLPVKPSASSNSAASRTSPDSTIDSPRSATPQPNGDADSSLSTSLLNTTPEKDKKKKSKRPKKEKGSSRKPEPSVSSRGSGVDTEPDD